MIINHDCSAVKLTARQFQIMLKATQMTDICSVVSIPLHFIDGYFGVVSWLVKPDRDVRHVSQTTLDSIFSFSHYFHQTISAFIKVDSHGRMDLSKREVECLSLLAIGHSLEDVAEALGISYATIRFHLKNAVTKLAATGRIHAVAKATSRGLIGPFR